MVLFINTTIRPLSMSTRVRAFLRVACGLTSLLPPTPTLTPIYGRQSDARTRGVVGGRGSLSLASYVDVFAVISANLRSRRGETRKGLAAARASRRQAARHRGHDKHWVITLISRRRSLSSHAPRDTLSKATR